MERADVMAAVTGSARTGRPDVDACADALHGAVEPLLEAASRQNG